MRELSRRSDCTRSINGRKAGGIGRRTRGVDQFRGREAGLQVAIEQHAHAGGQHQGGEELAVQFPAADHVEFAIALGCRPDGDQGERHALRQFLAPQEGTAKVPILAGGEPLLFVAEARRPLGAAHDGAIGGHQFQQIQIVGGGLGSGVIVVFGVVRLDGDVAHGFGCGDGVDGADQLAAAAVEFLAELKDQGLGALRFGTFKGTAGAVQHEEVHYGHRGHDGHREDQQEASAELHGRAPSSQRFSKRHSPEGAMPGPPLTRGLTP